jgi:putative cell wall-binding protein
VSQTEIVGGNGVVSPKNFKGLPSPSRLAGEDRYATAATVLQVYPPEGKLVFLATGEDFPDALTGGVVAAMNNSRILLISPTGPSMKEQLVLQAWSGRTPLVFGGPGVVSEEVYTHTQSLVQ